MLLLRWSVACGALLACVSGCSRGPEPEVVLYPGVNERGLITYSTTDPDGPEARERRRFALEQQQDAEEQQQDAEARRQQRERADQELIKVAESLD